MASLLAHIKIQPGKEDKWEAMLCSGSSADESRKSKTKSTSSRLSNIDFSGMD